MLKCTLPLDDSDDIEIIDNQRIELNLLIHFKSL